MCLSVTPKQMRSVCRKMYGQICVDRLTRFTRAISKGVGGIKQWLSDGSSHLLTYVQQKKVSVCVTQNGKVIPFRFTKTEMERPYRSTILRCRKQPFRGSAYCQFIREANKAKRLEFARRHLHKAEALTRRQSSSRVTGSAEEQT